MQKILDTHKISGNTYSATQQLSNSATQQLSNSATQQLSNSATQQLSNSATQQLSNSATQQLSNSATQQLSNSATQQLSNSATQQLDCALINGRFFHSDNDIIIFSHQFLQTTTVLLIFSILNRKEYHVCGEYC
ncbi:hypothetical protein [Treponema sp. OMZ 906]|uniref:hypothetical protein n=1 Tax=Treponema sp. OMZ 906 TaxID=2563662 RepID=UPI0020A5FD60|nr:hypothetical protein [Treponema sp. OMZ 906]UTC54519.1 hypothetical protein E4N69_06870 [Treponema sp. OMZ 906]